MQNNMVKKLNGKVFLKINSAFNHLGKAEQQVATFIKNYPEEVTKLPINLLAEKVGVSVSTIVRLCKRIDIEGYSDLKLKLAQDLAVGYRSTYSKLNPKDSIDSLYKNVEDVFGSTISDTYKLLDNKELEKAYKNIIKVNNILIIGAGGTAAMAMLLNHKLLKLDIKCNWSNDFSTIPLIISQMQEEDLLFAISHSGSTNVVFDAVQMAKKKKCKTILLTNYSQSPMANTSDIVLTTAVGEGPLGNEGGTTRIAQISIIEILCLLITLKEQDVF